MPAPKKAVVPKKATTTAAAKPAAKKPAPAKKPAAKKPAASIKAPAVKKPAVAKKAPTVPAVKAPSAKPALKAPAKPAAVKKPVAKIGAADGIKKTAIPATPIAKPAPKRAAAKPAVKPKAEVKAAVSRAVPAGFSGTMKSDDQLKETVATARPSDLGEEVTVLSADPTDHVVLAQTNPLGSDYTINFFSGKGGVAFRQLHVTAQQKSKKRLAIEVTISSVLKAVLGYENKRSQTKAFRGLTKLSVVVTRNSTSVTQPLSVLLHLNPLQAMAF